LQSVCKEIPSYCSSSTNVLPSTRLGFPVAVSPLSLNMTKLNGEVNGDTNDFENDINIISKNVYNINYAGDTLVFKPETFEKLAGGGLNSSGCQIELDSNQGAGATSFRKKTEGMNNSNVYNQKVIHNINLKKNLQNISRNLKRYRDEVKEQLDLDTRTSTSSVQTVAMQTSRRDNMLSKK